jgi:hypothetical protein
MSWHFSQALVEAFSEANCLDGEPFAPWKSTPIAADDSCSGKMKDTCHRSPFGMMFVLSTDGHGAELLTWFRAVSLARISAPQGRATGLKGREVDCGRRWRGSLVKFDPASRSWKTHQYSLLGDLEPYLETWPRWGSMRNGECWVRQTWARRTNETESGLWPTPNVPNGGRSVAHVEDWRGRTAYHNGKKVQVGLEAAVKMWPTPQAHDAAPGNPARVGRYGTKHGGRNLNDEVAKWPTPTVCGNYNRKGASAKSGDGLATVAGGALNPPWVEWLMGWPIGWTGCEPLETDKCHSAPLKRSEGF